LRDIIKKGGDLMPVDFFEKEFVTVCERYNQTFGSQSVCNQMTRCRVILAIIHMGTLFKEIKKAADKSMVRDDIKEFIRKKNSLMSIFSTAEKIFQERRRYDNGNQAERQSGQRSNVG
jgi:fructose-specific phosphotransferase system component IIB